MQDKIKNLNTPQSFSFSETLNFLATNYIPRAASTRLMGRLSKIEQPLFTKLAIKIWQFFSDDMRLHEAEKSKFNSVHDCFTRRLKPNARPIDPNQDLLISPCDAVIGAHGKIRNLEALQIKGMPYHLDELTLGTIDLAPYHDGQFITLRLKSSMYHHMHAPTSGTTTKLHYISGDTWNVNPPTLKRIEKLFCRNERAVIEFEPSNKNAHIALIPVAAILVASMRFEGLDPTLSLSYKGANTLDFQSKFERGEHLGHFEHGSTIVMLTSKHYSFMPPIKEGDIIRMGQALMRPNQLIQQSPTG